MHPIIDKLSRKFKADYIKNSIDNISSDTAPFNANKKLYNYSNIFEYLDQLQKIKNCLVILAVRDTAGHSFDERLQKKFENLGLKENLIRQWRAYIAILANGSVIYEKKGADKTSPEDYCGKVKGLSLQIISKPWEGGDDVSIKIDGIEYSMHIRGINIVVWDLKQNRLLDSVGFDTHWPPYQYVFRRYLDLDYRKLPASLAKRKKRETSRLLRSPIVLTGTKSACLDFAAKYATKINIRQILITEQNFEPLSLDCNWPVAKYDINQVHAGDLVIACPTSRNEYITIKKKMENDGLIFSINFLTANIVDSLLSEKRICVFYGNSHVEHIMWIFNEYNDNCNTYFLTFHYLADLPADSKNLLAEFMYLLKISDIFIYNTVISPLKRNDFNYIKFCAKKCITYSIPDMMFSGLFPQIDKNDAGKPNPNSKIRNFKNNNIIIHLFYYIQGNYERFIRNNMSNDEIYNIVSKDDYIPQEQIVSNFKYWIQYAQSQETETDLKIFDYVLDNYKNKKIYRDQTHPVNSYYYEVARRMNRDLNLFDKDILEKILEGHKKEEAEIMDFGDIPVLPCVARALDIKWATPDYKYTLLLGDNKTKVNVTFKEYIYMYCDFMRAVLILKKMKVLN